MRDISSKWGTAVAERGFAQIPNYLLQINMFVHDDHKISPAETVILFQLIASWWKKDEMPYPSMRTLSDRTGISERQVQRAIKGLEEKGYLKRTRSKIKGVISSNVYDLTPMLVILQTVAEHYVNKHPRNIKIGGSNNKEYKPNIKNKTLLDNILPDKIIPEELLVMEPKTGKFVDESQKKPLRIRRRPNDKQ
jgi:DNA-binding transcriptional regulator YhcF (GntR family)